MASSLIQNVWVSYGLAFCHPMNSSAYHSANSWSLHAVRAAGRTVLMVWSSPGTRSPDLYFAINSRSGEIADSHSEPNPSTWVLSIEPGTIASPGATLAVSNLACCSSFRSTVVSAFVVSVVPSPSLPLEQAVRERTVTNARAASFSDLVIFYLSFHCARLSATKHRAGFRLKCKGLRYFACRYPPDLPV